MIDGLKGKSIQVGAQNSAVEPMQGALTGEISPSQLVDAGCSYVLVGHSERRQMMGERDGTLNRKFAAAQACGLIPVFPLPGPGRRMPVAPEPDPVGQAGKGAVVSVSEELSVENEAFR